MSTLEDFEAAYRRYALPVQKYVLRLGANEELSQDITAEAFCRALDRLDSFDGRSSMLTWLCAIARNAYYDHCRRKEQQNLPLTEELAAVLPGGDPTLDAEDDEQRLLLYRAIRQLSPDAREVMYLRLLGDLSFAEIGRVLGRSENWARVTFYREKKRLKGLLQDDL